MKKLALLAPLALSIFACACSDAPTQTQVAPTPQVKPIVAAKTTATSTPEIVAEVARTKPIEVDAFETPKPNPTSVSTAKPVTTKDETKPVAEVEMNVQPKLLETKFRFNTRYTALIQTQGEKTNTLTTDADYISYYATYTHHGKALLAIFGGGVDETMGTLDVYADENADGLHQESERVLHLELGKGVQATSATFLESGELIYLDDTQQQIRRIVVSNGDKQLDMLSDKIFWSSARDPAFTGFSNLRAKTLASVTLVNTQTKQRYTISDSNGDGVGDSGGVEE